MSSRAKRINLKKIPGAQENQVQWMMCSGVRTVAEAKKVAAAFIADLQQVRAHVKAPEAKKTK